MNGKLPVALDLWDGKPLPRFWRWNNGKLPGKVLAKRKRAPHQGLNLWPEYTHDVWCGEFRGYGRRSTGEPLFRTLQNALAFAQAAYNAGIRRKR